MVTEYKPVEGARSMTREPTLAEATDLANLPYVNDHPDGEEVSKSPPDFREDVHGALLWAKDKWWKRLRTHKEICEETHMPMHVLKARLMGDKYATGWVTERERAYKKVLQSTLATERLRIDKLLERMLGILEESTLSYMANSEELTLKQYDTFLTSFEKLFKMRQLIMGNPTEIYQQADMTWDKVLAKLKTVDILDYEKLRKEAPIEVNGLNGTARQKLLPTGSSESDS